MKQQLKNYTTLLFKLVRTLVSFMLLFSFILIILYIAGNYQNFEDSTQFLILKAITLSAIFLGITAFLGIIFSVVFIFGDKSRHKWKGIRYIILMIFLLVLSLVLIISSVSLEYLSQGL